MAGVATAAAESLRQDQFFLAQVVLEEEICPSSWAELGQIHIFIIFIGSDVTYLALSNASSTCVF